MSDLGAIRAELLKPGSSFEVEAQTVDGRKVRCWKHAPGNLREVLDATRQFNEQTYLVYENERISYSRHYQAVESFAAALTRRFGVEPGDRVALAMRNYPEFVIAFWSVIALGAVVVPLNAWWRREELLFGVSDSGAKLLIADERRLTQIHDAPSLPPCVSVRTSFRENCTRFEDLLDPARALPLPEIDIERDHPATLFYTSGTTGSPKGVLGTHRHLCSTIWTSNFGISVGRLASGAPAPAGDRQNSALVTAPLFHVIGCFSGILVSTFHGHKLTLMYKWDPEQAARLIEQENINSMVMVPTVASQLLTVIDRQGLTLPSLERLSVGGAPVPPALVKRARKLLPNVIIGTGWGMTETASPSTHVFGEDFVSRPDCVGLPSPVCEVRLIDENGADVERGEHGELLARGPNVITRYWNNPKADREEFIDGWLRTGDVGWFDERGFLYLSDRVKDMIIRGGENVHSVEVENMILSFDGVEECAVFARPHAELGEEVVAVVVAFDDADVNLDALQAYLKERLAYFKVPSLLTLRRQPLPRNAAGKVLKHELKSSASGPGPR